MLKLVLSFVMIILFTACATNIISSKQAPTLEILEKLQYGELTKENIIAIFGAPNEIQDIKVTDEELWIYNRKNSENIRCEIFFDKQNRKLKRANWLNGRNDTEIDLNYLLKRYSHAHFQVKVDQPPNVDYISDEYIYSDTNLGLGIRYAAYNKEVDFISLSRPLNQVVTTK